MPSTYLILRSLIFLSILASSLLSFGQSHVIFEQKIEIAKRGRANLTDHFVLMPNSILGRQQVLDVSFSTKPDLIINKEDGYRLKYEVETLEGINNLVVGSELILQRNDWNTASTRQEPVKVWDGVSYLAADARVQSDAYRIKGIASSLVGRTREETVRNIFAYVVDTLEYDNSLREDRSALLALRTGRGDCTEYTELMIALCRANQIPARYVNGFVASRNYDDNPRHNWVEVYFEVHGWIAFDPTFADAENSLTTFDKMENRYIIVSFTRESLSGWRSFSPNSPTKYAYRTRNKFAGEIARIRSLVYSGSLDEAELRLDTLVTQQIADNRVYMLQAMVDMTKGAMKDALSGLQRALKASYFEEEKNPVYIRLAAYYAQSGNEEAAINTLKRVFGGSYHVNQYDFRFLTESSLFEPIEDLPYFQQVTSDVIDKFYYNISSVSDYDYFLDGWMRYITHDCTYPEELLQFPIKYLTRDQVLKQKIKVVKSESEYLNYVVQFNPEGLVTSVDVSYPLAGGIHNLMVFHYDKSGKVREKEIHTINKNELDTIALTSILFDYDNSCLLSIRLKSDGKATPDTLLEFVKYPDFFLVRTLGGGAILGTRNKTSRLFFDEKGRNRRLFTQAGRDTVALEWRYDDGGRSVTDLVNGNKQSHKIYDKNGEISVHEYGSYVTEYTYHKSGRLIGEIVRSPYGENTFKYKYNGKGLVREKTKRGGRGGLTVVESFEYEYY